MKKLFHKIRLGLLRLLKGYPKESCYVNLKTTNVPVIDYSAEGLFYWDSLDKISEKDAKESISRMLADKLSRDIIRHLNIKEIKDPVRETTTYRVSVGIADLNGDTKFLDKEQQNKLSEDIEHVI